MSDRGQEQLFHLGKVGVLAACGRALLCSRLNDDADRVVSLSQVLNRDRTAERHAEQRLKDVDAALEQLKFFVRDHAPSSHPFGSDIPCGSTARVKLAGRVMPSSHSDIEKGRGGLALVELARDRGAELDTAREAGCDWTDLPRRSHDASQLTSFAGRDVAALVNGRGRALPRFGRANAHDQVARRDARPSVGDLRQASVIVQATRGRSVSARRDPCADCSAYPAVHLEVPTQLPASSVENMNPKRVSRRLQKGPISQ